MEPGKIVNAPGNYPEKKLDQSIKLRKAKLRDFLRQLRLSKNEFYAAVNADLNRDYADTLLSELIPLCDICRHLIRRMSKLLKSRRLPGSLATFPAAADLLREPYGRVLVISTWNYPVLLSLEPALGAYAAGNRVVLKLSPRSPHCNAFIKRLTGKCFSSDELLVIGDELSFQQTLSSRYDYIFFTGNSAAGKEVLHSAAENLTPCTVELGGKNPCIVAERSNINIAARRIVWGKFFNAGQSCAAPDFLYVHKDIKADLMNKISSEIRKMYGEHPLDAGKYCCMPDKKAYDRACKLLSEGRLVCGGDRDPEKFAIEPTVIDMIDESSLLMQEEIFSPILPVMEYNSDAELLIKLNSQEKPLALYCFGASGKLQEKLISSTSSGALLFDDVLVHFSNMHIPFGGVGKSGYGAYHGDRTLTLFTHEKPVVKQWRHLDLPLRYPPHSKIFRKILEFFSHLG